MSQENESQSSPRPEAPIDLETAIRQRVLPDDARYGLAAYLFIYESLAFTQKRLQRDDPQLEAGQRHVSGQELLEGIREYAGRMFGPLAPTVFRSWGLKTTGDFGEIVFNLVEHELLGKTETDRREDFADGFDFDTAFEGSLTTRPE